LCASAPKCNLGRTGGRQSRVDIVGIRNGVRGRFKKKPQASKGGNGVLSGLHLKMIAGKESGESRPKLKTTEKTCVVETGRVFPVRGGGGRETSR